ncbi:ribose transport system permease protein [Proteiniborus sp. DW1]|uniref:ABC transporter permease n=1 Tax=Proteiniborus sp. DW1 TaxID=1889883 RepID=UPI00092E0D91|nr:ABC transporter permease [Proteiniborus sp. DW1]SCG82875.1 ribose transport system permease protein [Proteiniborus sp. DW1]
MNENLKTRLEPYRMTILLFSILSLMVIVLSIVSPFFLTLRNIKNILDQTSIYIILSVGMTFVICSGGIDLSIGSVIAFSAVISGIAMKGNVSVGVSVLLGLVVAMLIGCLNGFLISFIKINPLIVTLSTMSIFRGINILITNGKPVFGFSKAFTYWGSGSVGWLNWPIIISFIITLLGIIILSKTRFGYYTIGIGANEEALRRNGINTKRYKILIYTLCGFCAGIAGFIISARLNTAEPLAGTGYEMDAIAAVVLGGTDMNGGKGSISGTFIACLILGVMKNGLRILSISSNYQQLLTGLIILLSVASTEYKVRRKAKAH